MTLKDWATVVVSVLALGISIWTRVESTLERRKRDKQAGPWAELNLATVPAIMTEQNGEDIFSHQASMLFHNTLRNRVLFDSLEICEPSGLVISARDGTSTPTQGRKIAVKWIAMPEHEAPDGCSGKFFITRPPNYPQPELETFIVRCSGIEASSVRKRITVEASLLIKKPSAAVGALRTLLTSPSTEP